MTLGVYWGHGLLHLAVDISRQGEADIGKTSWSTCVPRCPRPDPYYLNDSYIVIEARVPTSPWPRWPPLYRYKLQPTKHLDVSVLPRLVTTLITVQLTVFLPVRCNSVRASNEGS